jgi:4-amino-4-deoxy-L-arabinose transferase-like glycosyltransferase
VEKEITIEIKKPEIVVLLIFLSIVLILELRLTFTSPIVFGDEGYHTRISQYIAQNVDYIQWVLPVEGTKISAAGFHRLPLWHLLQASFYFIFGFHDIIVKFLTPLVGVILIGIVTFLLGKELKSKEVGLFAAIIVVSIHSFITYSVLFYTDILLTFSLVLFLLTFVKAIKTEKKINWILAGAIAGLTFLTDRAGLIVLPFILLSFLYQLYRKKQFPQLLKNYIFLLIPCLVLISAYFIRNTVLFNNPFCQMPEYLISWEKFFKNSKCSIDLNYKSNYNFEGSSTGVGTEMEIFKMGIINYILFAYGSTSFISPLFAYGLIVIFAFICGLFTVYQERVHNDVYLILITATFLLIFYVSLGGRAEDAARNTVGLVPFVVIIAAVYFEKLYSLLKKYKIILAIIFSVFIISFSLWSLFTKLESLKSVKNFSPYFFEACNFIKENTSENALLMTVWDHGTIYNCQRMATSFGYMSDSPDIAISGNLTLVLERLKANGITHIFIQKFSISKRFLTARYPKSFIDFMDKYHEHFKKIYENGPSISSCETQNGYTQDEDLVCDGTIVYEIKY